MRVRGEPPKINKLIYWNYTILSRKALTAKKSPAILRGVCLLVTYQCLQLDYIVSRRAFGAIDHVELNT
jgi:hypothetical protein